MIDVHKECQYVADLDDAGDCAAWSFEGGAEILKVVVGILGSEDGGATIKFDSLEGGTRGDGDIAEITVPAANSQGQCLVEVPSAGTRIAAGGSLIAEVTADDLAAALPAVIKVVWRDLGEYNANSDSVDSA